MVKLYWKLINFVQAFDNLNACNLPKNCIMKNIKPYRIKTISEYHKLKGLPKPEHPLVSVIHLDETQQLTATQKSWVFDFYSITLKRNFDSKVKYKYGQQTYDFDEGVMFFITTIRNFFW